MIPGVATPAVVDRLRGAAAGTLPVLSRSEHAVYLDVDGSAVGVLSAHAVRVPCGIGTLLESVRSLTEPAHLSDGRLRFGEVEVRIGRLCSQQAPALLPHALRGDAWSALTEVGPDVRGFVAAFVPGTITARVALDLLGRGPGLTPLGDDILAGWLAVHSASGRPDGVVADVVRTHRERTTTLSATLLDHAVAGDVVPEFADFLRDVGSPRAADSAERLTRVGATSGAGLLVGAALAQRRLTAERNVA
ncbi:MAG: DUF2877 domain-containing protein [Nocardioides sp.]